MQCIFAWIIDNRLPIVPFQMASQILYTSMEQDRTYNLPLFTTFFCILPQTAYFNKHAFSKVMNIYEHKKNSNTCGKSRKWSTKQIRDEAYNVLAIQTIRTSSNWRVSNAFETRSKSAWNVLKRRFGCI